MSQSTQTPTPPAPLGRAPLGPAVFAVATATFSVVTTEMLPVGLLTSIGSGLRVTDGTAGLAVTLPGLVAALAALLLPVAVRRADRRTVLCALMALLAAANLASALAPAFGVLLVARVLVGVCIGGVWAIAAGLGVRLVREEAAAGRATAVIFSGIAVASVLGVPAGTFLGEVAGWRWGFAALAALSLAVAGLLATVLPALPAGEAVRIGAFARLLRIGPLRAGLLAVTLLVTGHFAAYTYVRPVLERAPGIGAGLISGLLLAYGTAGIVGNFAGGAVAARDPRRALLAPLRGARHGGAPAGARGRLARRVGGAAGGVGPGVRRGLGLRPELGDGRRRRTPREAASALFAAVFNVAIALGAFARPGRGQPRGR